MMKPGDCDEQPLSAQCSIRYCPGADVACEMVDD